MQNHLRLDLDMASQKWLRLFHVTIGKTNILKMYFLLNMGIFQCHVSFQGCVSYPGVQKKMHVFYKQ